MFVNYVCGFLFAFLAFLVILMLTEELYSNGKIYSSIVPACTNACHEQVARVYNDYGKEVFSADELSFIYADISETDLLNYNPFLVDNIKNYFLDNTYQAWYPGTSVIKNPGSIQTYYYQKIPGLRLLFSMGLCFG
ncbi:MAG: hypothetical protein HDQ96_01315 [Lachnospiraceae bacterium]|nr:hypothetical protein [Lachnospiraceae bacterium]